MKWIVFVLFGLGILVAISSLAWNSECWRLAGSFDVAGMCR